MCMRLVPMKEDIGRLGVEYAEQSRHAHDVHDGPSQAEMQWTAPILFRI